MKWSKVFSKGLKGLGSVIAGLLVAQIPAISNVITGLIPEEYGTMTVAGFVAFLINAFMNWFKHKRD